MTGSIDRDLVDRFEYQEKLREELRKKGCPTPPEKRSLEVCGNEQMFIGMAWKVFGSCKYSTVCNIKRLPIEDELMEHRRKTLGE